MDEIKELQERLKILTEREDKRRRDELAALVPEYVYEIVVTPGNRGWMKVWNADYGILHLRRKCVNFLDIKPKGHAGQEYEGMEYVYNRVTGVIIINARGGYILWEDQMTADRLSAFMKANPNGGDVTEILKDAVSSWNRK